MWSPVSITETIACEVWYETRKQGKRKHLWGRRWKSLSNNSQPEKMLSFVCFRTWMCTYHLTRTANHFKALSSAFGGIFKHLSISSWILCVSRLIIRNERKSSVNNKNTTCEKYTLKKQCLISFRIEHWTVTGRLWGSRNGWIWLHTRKEKRKGMNIHSPLDGNKMTR